VRRQHGTSTVEFAIVGLLFFSLLFGVIEAGRALFVWNGLTEMTRRGARVAAVCPMNHPDIARVAIMAGPGSTGDSPVMQGLSTANVSVRYLAADGSVATGYETTRFVQVSIANYQHALLFPFGVTLDAPAAVTTLPAESLGYIPDLEIRACFGA
jgi:Flp pilus assembly protein TadG